MRRFLVSACIVSLGAVGAWALPAGHADSTVEPAATADPVAAPPPAVDAPVVSATADRVETADGPVGEGPAPREVVASLDLAGDEPDHLADDVARPAAEAPAPIVTTTLAPPTTLPPSTTTTAPAVAIAFHAAQAYGSCDEPVPYDIFSGQATPGSTVSVSSPYGSGSTTADGQGHWERKVEFPAAPRGETFTVAVSGLGGSTTFSFTATGGGSHT